MSRDKSMVNKVKDSLELNGENISEAASRLGDKIEGEIVNSVNSLESGLDKAQEKLKGLGNNIK